MSTTSFHYKARILPDGHLPVPAGCVLRAGEEVDITLLAAEQGNGLADATQRADYLLKNWAGGRPRQLTVPSASCPRRLYPYAVETPPEGCQSFRN